MPILIGMVHTQAALLNKVNMPYIVRLGTFLYCSKASTCSCSAEASAMCKAKFDKISAGIKQVYPLKVGFARHK